MAHGGATGRQMAGEASLVGRRAVTDRLTAVDTRIGGSARRVVTPVSRTTRREDQRAEGNRHWRIAELGRDLGRNRRLDLRHRVGTTRDDLGPDRRTVDQACRRIGGGR